MPPKKLERASSVNLFSASETCSEDRYIRTGLRVSLSHWRDHERIVLEIINKIFDDKLGGENVSSSDCPTPPISKPKVRIKSKPKGKDKDKLSVGSYDKRLKYWRDMVAERKRLAEYISKHTKKEIPQMLFNRSVTIDDRDKQTVKRLLDYAKRMNPIILRSRKSLKLRDHWHEATCQPMHELSETLPEAEQLGMKVVELTGLTNATKEEQLGKELCKANKSLWMNSKVLENYVDKRRRDIERVIEFYPDIDNLEVVGESLLKREPMKHNDEISFLGAHEIEALSSDTSICLNDSLQKEELPFKQLEEPFEYGIKINELVYKFQDKRGAKNVEVNARFECEPFEKVKKRLLHLENIGTKVLSCEWLHRSFYAKIGALLKANDKEFSFNSKSFRLAPGETYDCVVTFEPRRVEVVKEKWLLRIEPQIFCRRLDGVVIQFFGKCRPPAEYVNKLAYLQQCVLDKSHLKMSKYLINGLASMSPLVKPAENVCPYRRTLEEREIFEALNPGYKCERYNDLEMLKEMHRRLKKPREKDWDLNLNTLKELLLRQPTAEERALLYNEMMGIVEQMRGVPLELNAKLEKAQNEERDQTRFVYVRGIVCAAIDEWETMTVSMEETLLKAATKAYWERLNALDEQRQGSEEQDAEFEFDFSNMPREEEEVELFLIDKIRKRKVVRDALFLQTYTHLCDTAENIVSVIDSTEII